MVQVSFPSETFKTVAGASGFDWITCSEMLDGRSDAVSNALNKCLKGIDAVMLSISRLLSNLEIVGPQNMDIEPEGEFAVTFLSTTVR